MTSGLEISEIQFSQVVKNDIFRLDSFYYSKEFLHKEYRLSTIETISVKCAAKSILSFGAYALNNNFEYVGSGIPFIRAVNMKNGFIDFSNMLFIDTEAHNLLHKSEVKPNTVLLSMSGSVGDVAVTDNNSTYPINSNQDIAKIHFDDTYSPYLAYLFFLGRYGQDFMRREARGSVQQHVFLSQIEKCLLPIFSEDFTDNINRVVKHIFRLHLYAEKAYTKSSMLLLKSLGIEKLMLSANAITLKSLSESFGTSGRLDAEYYQAKYDSLFTVLSDLPCKKLGNLVKIEKSIEPGSEYYSEEGIPFIRISDITPYGVSPSSINIPAYLTGLRPKKDTILLSKDGSVGIAYKAENDMEVITSGALLHLTVKHQNLQPDYLTLVLNSVIVRMQAERDAGGSIIQHWKPSEIAEVLIPVLEYHTQSAIAAQVKRSFALRRRSAQILEWAKSTVEIAVEQGEKTAIAWLKEKGVEANGKL